MHLEVPGAQCIAMTPLKLAQEGVYERAHGANAAWIQKASNSSMAP